MKLKIIQSFSCIIHRGGGEQIDLNKKFAGTNFDQTYKSLKDYIQKNESQRLDLDSEIWIGSYLQQLEKN